MTNALTNTNAVTIAGDVGDRFESFPVTPEDVCNWVEGDEKCLQGLSIEGEHYKVSDRFLKGLAKEMKVPQGIYSLFSPTEVIMRAADRAPDAPLRLTVDHRRKVALGLVADHGHALPVRGIVNIMRNDPRTRSITYHDGVISAKLDLNESWYIRGDSQYQVQIACDVPVDSLREPTIGLGTLRQVCSNGAVAEAKIFVSKMQLKDNSGAHFGRLLESFSNPEGVETLHERLIAANATKASVGELYNLDQVLNRAIVEPHNRMSVRERLLEMAGNPCVRYGVTDLSRIGEKRRALLPVDCSVADVLNFASELATHHPDVLTNMKGINGYTGALLSKGFDLEDLYPNAQPAARFHMRDLELARKAA